MSHNEWLDIEVLEDYLDGKLDAKAMHRVEKLSLEDPFVAEALAGLSQSPRRVQSLSLLQKQLQDRVAQKPIEQKRWRITSQRLSIAATAAVLFITVSLLFWMRENNRQKILAGQPKKIEVKIAPPAAKETPAPAVENSDNKLAAAMDKAIAQAKTSRYATNAKPKRAIETPKAVEKTEAIVADKVAMKAAVPAAAPLAATALSVEEIKVENPAAKRNANNVQVLSGKAEGVSYNGGVYAGRVISQFNGLPIYGAVVKLQGANLMTTTDRGGEFKLSAEQAGSNPTLSISGLGFAAKEIKAEANKKLEVSLAPVNNSLAEVAIVAAKEKAKGTVQTDTTKRLAEPVGGIEAFEKYLQTNNRIFKGSTSTRSVIVGFDVVNGLPTNIKVVNGLTQAENDEAVRLIKEGPKWIVLPKTTSVMIHINF